MQMLAGQIAQCAAFSSAGMLGRLRRRPTLTSYTPPHGRLREPLSASTTRILQNFFHNFRHGSLKWVLHIKICISLNLHFLFHLYVKQITMPPRAHFFGSL